MTFTYTLTYFLVTLTCALISIAILLQLNINMGSEQEVKAFRNYVFWYLIFVLTNMIWVWINYGFLNWLGSPFSIINLVAICISSYYWFKFVEARIAGNFVNNPLFRFISLVPLIVAIILIVTTPFTNLIFSYSGNEYIHGPFYPTMFILAISYLLFATIHIITKINHNTSNDKKRDYYFLAGFLLFPVVAGVIDIVAENLPVMELALLLGTLLIYTNFQQSQIYNDSLTKLNNRRAVDNYLSSHFPFITNEKPLYFYMLDVDFFKSINDTYGHIEGDKVLRIVGNALSRWSEDHHHFVARYGGDEFCVIINNKILDNHEEVHKEIQSYIDEEMKANNMRYELTISMGYAECVSPYSSVDKVIDAADKVLYENKKKNNKGR